MDFRQIHHFSARHAIRIHLLLQPSMLTKQDRSECPTPRPSAFDGRKYSLLSLSDVTGSSSDPWFGLNLLCLQAEGPDIVHFWQVQARNDSSLQSSHLDLQKSLSLFKTCLRHGRIRLIRSIDRPRTSPWFVRNWPQSWSPGSHDDMGVHRCRITASTC